jgi:hypothetical protein
MPSGDILNPLQISAILRQTAHNLHRFERLQEASRHALAVLETLDQTHPAEDMVCACEEDVPLCLRCQLRVVREVIGLLRGALT